MEWANDSAVTTRMASLVCLCHFAWLFGPILIICFVVVYDRCHFSLRSSSRSRRSRAKSTSSVPGHCGFAWSRRRLVCCFSGCFLAPSPRCSRAQCLSCQLRPCWRRIAGLSCWLWRVSTVRQTYASSSSAGSSPSYLMNLEKRLATIAVFCSSFFLFSSASWFIVEHLFF